MSTTRRIYLYLLSLISMGVLAAGLGQLLALLFGTVIKSTLLVERQSFSFQQLSLGLAMVIIAGPLWFFFWRSIQRRVTGNAEEVGTGIRKFYLNFILLVTVFAALISASEVLRWMIGGASHNQFSAATLAIGIVAAAVWFIHHRIAEKEGHPTPAARTLRRWYTYIASGFGLVWLASGFVGFVSAGVTALPFWSGTLVRSNFWSVATQMAVAHMVLGGLAWYYHWFRMTKGDFDSVLRQVYFYLLTITGGAIAALAGITVTFQRILTWAFGGVRTNVSQHFQFIGWAIPLMLVGAAIWAYHQRSVKEEIDRLTERRQSAERVYLYLMSFIGLGTMAAGLIILFGVLLNLVIGLTGSTITLSGGWWQNQLGISLALLIVGTPLWLYYWGKVLKRVEAGAIDEWRAVSRRSFLYIVVIVAIGGLIADLVNIVYQTLNGILQGTSGNILRGIRWSLQTLIIVAPVLWYHWRIIRADQKRGAEAAAGRKNVTLLAGEATAAAIEAKLGYRVRLLHREGTTQAQAAISEEELARVMSEIEAAPTRRVMVVEAGTKVSVLPYREK